MNRLAALQALLESDPKNEFVRYGLAQELAKSGDHLKALAEFRRIIAENANYQAAYYHAGKTLERLGRIPEAQETYRLGIEASFRTGDSHARSELEAAFQEIST